MISESDARANFIDPKLSYNQWESIHIVEEYYLKLGFWLSYNKKSSPVNLKFAEEGINITGL